MKRRELEIRAKKELEEKGYAVARAMSSARVIGGKYIAHYNDFFNAFDLIAVKDNEVRFIQVTSGKQLSSHKKKVKDNFPFFFPKVVTVELWYYYKLGRKWEYKISFLRNGIWMDSVL
ncbi:MAG: hypothetical protein ACP5RE_03530 [Candidatus Acidifodinimicrobium sp.]